MADIIKKIRTTSGDSQIDFGSLANRFTINNEIVEGNENIMDKIIDDTQASSVNPWSGFKVNEEITGIQQSLNYLLGVNIPQTFDEVLKAVQSGLASEYFVVGDQLKPNWSSNDTPYEDPFDIVQLECNPELESGETIHGMMIQQHYANVKGCPFDAQEALYDADEELPAGTYHFTVSGHGLASEDGKSIQFTLTQPIPAGGQLVSGTVKGFDEPIAGQIFFTFSGPTSFSPIESVTMSEGSDGEYLGITDGNGNLNNITHTYRGSNRWKTSMLRQYLNSDKPSGEWWTKQGKWDRASKFINTCPGYLAGFDEDFLAIIKPVKVQTAVNDIFSTSGVDITYDKFFPASMEQLNVVPDVSTSEGEALDYWKKLAEQIPASDLDNGRFKQRFQYAVLIVYRLDSKITSANNILRSIAKSQNQLMWAIGGTGEASPYNIPSVSSYCAPACVIG